MRVDDGPRWMLLGIFVALVGVGASMFCAPGIDGSARTPSGSGSLLAVVKHARAENKAQLLINRWYTFYDKIQRWDFESQYEIITDDFRLERGYGMGPVAGLVTVGKDEYTKTAKFVPVQPDSHHVMVVNVTERHCEPGVYDVVYNLVHQGYNGTLWSNYGQYHFQMVDDGSSFVPKFRFLHIEYYYITQEPRIYIDTYDLHRGGAFVHYWCLLLANGKTDLALIAPLVSKKTEHPDAGVLAGWLARDTVKAAESSYHVENLNYERGATKDDPLTVKSLILFRGISDTGEVIKLRFRYTFKLFDFDGRYMNAVSHSTEELPCNLC